ncbi:PilZ domain-containing protein [Jannaschia sp. 2305UL9-9]|uniref:PilZ domain-containing protein n=1 Tax=Jannaschia sp. 2305UL9-9 TaxID=3121638 RepID=UPI003527D932
MTDRPERFRSTMQITVCYDGSETTAKILDVSRYGMKIFFKAGLPEEAIVGLRALNLTLEAEVRWSRRGHCGLALGKPLTPDQLDMLTGAARPRSSPFFTKPARNDRHDPRRPVHDPGDGRIRG